MFVRRAIDHYLKGKRSRRDVTRFLETHPDLDRLAERIADEIREGRYRDTRITYFNRVEPISGKHRVIGRESVRHQIYDHVAVMALQAGNDLVITTDYRTQIPKVLEAVENGTLSMDTIDTACRRVLTWKQNLGLL